MKTKHGRRHSGWDKFPKKFRWIIDRDLEFTNGGEIYRGIIANVHMRDDALVLTLSYILKLVEPASREKEAEWEIIRSYDQSVEISKSTFEPIFWNDGIVSFSKYYPGPNPSLTTWVNYGLSNGYQILSAGDNLEGCLDEGDHEDEWSQ